MSLPPEELALARACAAGDPGAIATFEREHFGVIDDVARRGRMDADELKQVVRERLFVAPPGGAPRVATFAGTGSLAGWVRVLATRAMIDAQRSEGARPDQPSGDDALVDAATPGIDPELSFLKDRYREHFRAAFRESLTALTPRERNLLRHRYLDGVEVGALATIYGLHRVSASRTLTRIRETLLAHVRAGMMARLGVDAGELDSIMGLIGSQLESSLSGLLASQIAAKR